MALADHAFVEALTSLSMIVVEDRADEEMLIDCAAKVEPQVNLAIEPLCRVVRAFAALRAARKAGTKVFNERADLREALRAFHRWRLGGALAALRARTAG